MFIVETTNLQKLKSSIQNSKNRRLACRRTINRLLSGGGDAIEIIGEGKEGNIYEVTLIFSLENVKKTTFTFDLNICSETPQQIYNELKESAKQLEGDMKKCVSMLTAENGKTTLGHLFCNKLTNFIKDKRNQMKTKKIGRFNVTQSCKTLHDCNNIK